ncbi:hypothetical protein JCM10213_005005 [Rhodosporidiobolus nylandii]
MVYRFSGVVQLVYFSNSDTSGYQAKLDVPGFDNELVVQSTARDVFSIRWKRTKAPIYLKEGHIELKDGMRSRSSALLMRIDLGTGDFPPSLSGRFEGDSGSQSGTTTVQVDLELVLGEPPWETALTLKTAEEHSAATKKSLDVAEQKVVKAQQEFARMASVSTTSRNSTDVCLRFARSGRRLWASQSFLEQASPYYQQLLSSDFAEGSTSYCDAEDGQHFDDYAFAESDEETDKVEVKKKANKDEFSLPFKTVSIFDTSFTTYRAVLVWLASQHIDFAPLRSSFHAIGEPLSSASTLRAAGLHRTASRDSLLPQPASPKSVYRLAHLLELPTLSSLAIENLRSQLTPQNAAYELYSDAATCYPALRDVVLDYVVENWQQVKKEKATKEVEGKALAGLLEAAALGTAMVLAARLK